MLHLTRARRSTMPGKTLSIWNSILELKLLVEGVPCNIRSPSAQTFEPLPIDIEDVDNWKTYAILLNGEIAFITKLTPLEFFNIFYWLECGYQGCLGSFQLVLHMCTRPLPGSVEIRWLCTPLNLKFGQQLQLNDQLMSFGFLKPLRISCFPICVVFAIKTMFLKRQVNRFPKILDFFS